MLKIFILAVIAVDVPTANSVQRYSAGNIFNSFGKLHPNTNKLYSAESILRAVTAARTELTGLQLNSLSKPYVSKNDELKSKNPLLTTSRKDNAYASLNGLSNKQTTTAASKTVGKNELGPTDSNITPEVFLGGSCNPTTWRAEIAIPTLKKLGISFYNPQVSDWTPDLIELEFRAKEKARVLFLVIDSRTRASVSAVEVAYIAGQNPRHLVLVLNAYKPHQSIYDELITPQEYIDLNRNQQLLRKIVLRRGLPVLDDVPSGLQRTKAILNGTRFTTPQNAHSGIVRNVQMFQWDSATPSPINQTDNAHNGHSSRILRILTQNESPLTRFSIHSNEDPMLNGISFDQQSTNSDETEEKLSESNDSVFPSGSSIESILNDDSHLSHLEDAESPDLRDIYLGGSCALRSNWRNETIRMLNQHDLTYHMPQLHDSLIHAQNGSDPDGHLTTTPPVQFNLDLLEASRVLLFVISNETRSIAPMTLAAHSIGLGYNVVLCVQMLPENCSVGVDKLSVVAVKDYNRARSYLTDLAERHDVPVFSDLEEAVECSIAKVKQSKRRAST